MRCCSDSGGNVETGPGTAEVALPVPAHVALQLVHGVKPALGDQALCQTERHGCVICPLAAGEPERTSAHDVRNGRERARWLELQSGAQGIAHSQAQQAATVTVGVHAGNRHPRGRKAGPGTHSGATRTGPTAATPKAVSTASSMVSPEAKIVLMPLVSLTARRPPPDSLDSTVQPWSSAEGCVTLVYEVVITAPDVNDRAPSVDR